MTKNNLGADGIAPKAGMVMLTPCWALCHFPGQQSEGLFFILEENVPLAEMATEQESFQNYSMSLTLCIYLLRRCGPCCSVAHLWLHAAIISTMGSKHRGKSVSFLSALTPCVFDCCTVSFHLVEFFCAVICCISSLGSMLELYLNILAEVW